MVTDALIVGAGLSGLIAANKLHKAGKIVTVVDKGRSTGGRLATRRIGDGIADHGAQFFTVRTETFREQVDEWLADDLVYVWGHGWSDGSLKRTQSDGHPRYAAKGGMNNIAKNLEENLDNVHVNTFVTDVKWDSNIWHVITHDGASFDSKVLILTPPVPQALNLLNNVPMSDVNLAELRRIEYGPCLCGLFVVDGDVNLPEPGARQNFDDAIYWIADNKAKGISEERIITMHVEARYSRVHYLDPDETTLSYLAKELQEYLGEGATIQASQLKKWRYSLPITTYPRDILQAAGLPLIFAGDAFGGRGRVEGAFMSGYAAGDTALELLK
ncbi:MAG: FAD-dependent oxidoreductase [Anaerolineae bacterium]|nr:FAD-dependent oxidoreductase [Anaerolineae bacterium]MDQ7035999.1 FAD-dependent oxidoreductase [Anaerolineae bacterium]